MYLIGIEMIVCVSIDSDVIAEVVDVFQFVFSLGGLRPKGKRQTPGLHGTSQDSVWLHGTPPP